MRLLIFFSFFLAISYIPITDAALPDPNVVNSCGGWSSDRIFGGEATAIDEFPWMALLEYTYNNKGKLFLCGGSLIDERHVITAAHCILKYPRLTGVRLGELNISSPVDCASPDDCTDPPQDIPVEKIFKHQYYNLDKTQQHNDIAILRLKYPVTPSYFVQPICLPMERNLRYKTEFPDTEFIVAGWGRTENNTQSDVKLKTSIDGVTLDSCNTAYEDTGMVVIDKQVCAGGQTNNDSCQGDSGGPLMALYRKGKQSYIYLAGIVSYGPSACGTLGVPGVYTRTGAYIKWIQNVIKAP